MPVGGGIIALLLAVLLVLLFCVAAFGSYNSKERVSGLLVSSGGSIEITVPESGVIRDILVGPGQRVEKDHQLFVFGRERLFASGGPLSSHRVNALKSQRDTLEAQINGLASESRIDAAVSADSISGLETQKAYLIDQIDQQARTVELEADSYRRVEQLAKDGYVTLTEQANRELNLIRARGEFSSLRRSFSALERELAEAKGLVPLDQAQYDRRRAELARELHRIDQELIEVNADRTAAITSPVVGRVSLLSKKRGERVGRGETVLAIRPADDRLQAELQVPSRSVGLLEVGQDVNLMYDAFPPQQYGVATGKIASVSETPVKADANTLVGESSTEAHFVIIVDLDREHFRARERNLKLRPGMTLTADIITGRRKIWQWISQSLRGLS